MKFLNFANKESRAEIKEKYDRYLEYLDAHTEAFSVEAFGFATADWHYDFEDPRCTHDSWIESFVISEDSISEPKTNKMRIRIKLILLGAYHDGQIEIDYEGVRGYSLILTPDRDYDIRHHGDWIIDEVRVTENNWLVHEIKFWLDGDWQIECDNITYNWKPFDSRPSDDRNRLDGR